jgi:hypothetical protein
MIDFLAHAAGVEADLAVQVRAGQLEAVTQLGASPRRLRVQPAQIVQTRAAGQPRPQAERAWNVADPGQHAGQVTANVLAEHSNRATGGSQQPEHAADRGGLACPVGPEVAQRLTVANLQGHPADGRHPAVVLDQIVNFYCVAHRPDSSVHSAGGRRLPPANQGVEAATVPESVELLAAAPGGVAADEVSTWTDVEQSRGQDILLGLSGALRIVRWCDWPSNGGITARSGRIVGGGHNAIEAWDDS